MSRKKKDFFNDDVTIDKRLQTALLYKKLLERSVLTEEEKQLPGAENVEADLNSFIKEKLEILLALRPDPVKERKRNDELVSLNQTLKNIEFKLNSLSSTFSEQDSQVLKALVKATLGTPTPTVIPEPPKDTIVTIDSTGQVVPKSETYEGSSGRKFIEKVIDGKTVKMDVTGQVVPKDGSMLPPATSYQYEVVAQQQATLLNGGNVGSLISVLSSGVNNNNSPNEE